MKHLFYSAVKSNKGTSTVIYAVLFAVIVAFAALAVDVGIVFLEKSRLSSAVDAAVLAGAQELISESGNVRNVVDYYIQENNIYPDQIDVSVDKANHTIEIKAFDEINSYFARFLGINEFSISTSAAARVENIKTITGARPLAVIHQDFKYGELYTLKEGAGDGTSGNYAAISLGGAGASIYKNNMLYGYEGTISVSDLIPTETGNMSGTTELTVNHLISQCTHTPPCTHNYYNKTCSRIIFIPVVDTLDVNGRKYVKVLGFGTFFLEGVTSNGGKADVAGRFITYTSNGETSNEINDYGTYGIRLIK